MLCGEKHSLVPLSLFFSVLNGLTLKRKRKSLKTLYTKGHLFYCRLPDESSVSKYYLKAKSALQNNHW